MSERGDIESVQQAPLFPEHMSAIFERLDASDVEHFYKSYHLWSLQRRIEILQVETELLQRAIADNDELQQQVRPSAIALASLAQFQASGVDDIDLLDRMLERGEGWLDHTIQLLRHCEDLDVIGSNYTQWCEHALEGAYDWIESMNSIENDAAPVDTQLGADTATEEQLLQKLMSEDEQIEKLLAVDHKSKGTVDVAEEIAEIVPVDENISAPVEIPEISTDSATAEIEETVPIDDSAPEETVAVEEESLQEPIEITHNAEKARQEGALEEVSSTRSSIASAAVSAREERSVPQARQGGFRRFLRRLLALFWHE